MALLYFARFSYVFMIKSYIAVFINIFAEILTFAILARVILSFLATGSHSKVTQLIKDVTDPILRPLKEIIPPIGMMDITPIIAFFLIGFARDILLYLILFLP